MSVTHEIVIWCDSCCDWRRLQTTNQANTARKALRAYGWTHANGKDFCGSCNLHKRIDEAKAQPKTS